MAHLYKFFLFLFVFLFVESAGFLGLAPNQIAAFQDDEPAEADARLVLNLGGAVGEIQAVRFSGDGNRLFSAGDDKVVRVWDILSKPNGDVERVSLSKKIYWQVSRSWDGRIYDLAVSPDGKSIAMAGISAVGASDIWIYGADTGVLKKVLTDHKSQKPIYKLAYSPDGKHLASISFTGEVLLWNSETWKSTVLQQSTPAESQFWSISFVGNNSVAFPVPVNQSADGFWNFNVHMYDMKERRAQKVANSRSHRGFVYSIASDRDGKNWATCDAIGNVFVYQNRSFRRNLRVGKVARSLKIDRNNHLYVVNLYDPPSKGFAGSTSSIEKWNLGTLAMQSNSTRDGFKDIWDFDISPDGKTFAVASQMPNRVAVGAVSKGMLKDPNLKTISANVSTVQNVRFANYAIEELAENVDVTEMPNRLHLSISGNDKTIVEFDLKTLAFRTKPIPKRTKPTPIVWNLRGPIAVNQQQMKLNIVEKNQPYCEIVLDRVLHQRVTAARFLGAKKGKKPWGFAIATAPLQGIFVYQLPAQKNGAPKLVRYFRDHVGDITALRESLDGRFLASASTDATTKIWSLSGLDDPKASLTWKMWGAEFGVEDELVQVKKLDPAGILASRGVQLNDSIPTLELKKKTTDQTNSTVESTDEIISLLNSIDRMWKDTTFSVEHEDDGFEKNIRAGWEPVVSLLVTPDNHWAIWSPKGYYASSEIGDNFFGWVTNRGRDVRPLFNKASTLRQDFEKPEVIKMLVESGNLPEALNAYKIEPKSVVASIEMAPQVKIIEPVDGTLIEKDKVQLKVQIASAKIGITEFDCRAFVNGVPLKRPKWSTTGNRATLTWDLELLDYMNRISVKVTQQEGTLKSVLAEGITVLRTSTPNSRKRKIHLFALSAQDYADDDLKLEFPHEDAKAIENLVLKKIGSTFELGQVRHYQMPSGDFDYTALLKKEFAAFEKKIAGKMDPNDLLIVFVAGHGWYDIEGVAPSKEFFFIPPHEKMTSRIGNFKRRDLSVSWQVFIDFFEDVDRFGCRRIYLLDTCHSGGAKHYYRAARSLFDNEALVLSACTSDGKSYESPDLRHGLFTHSILRAIDNGLADGFEVEKGKPILRDGVVTLDEAKDFIIDDVANLADQYSELASDIRQQPVAFGSSDLWYITLSKILSNSTLK